MKVLLVNPNVGYFNSAVFNPLGLLAIGSYLKSIGHEVKLLDRCVETVNFKKYLASFRPEVVGFSIMSPRGIKDAVKLSKIAKQHGCYVTWGGAVPTIQPEMVLKETCIDSVIISEGEYTFRELLETLESGSTQFENIKGLAYRESGVFRRNADRPFADLSQFPMTDYSLIHVEKYLIPYLGCERLMYMYSGKGCPCSCTFCTNTSFHKSCSRKRPNAYVIAEIKYLIENYGLDGVYFSDELWCADKKEMFDFCRRVKEENLKFSWFIMSRVDQFSKEEYELMFECGCRGVMFGIETGSREMMKKIHKNINYDRIIPSFAALKHIGITNIASFIIGYPDETVEQLKDTVNLIQHLDAHLTPVFHLTPLPGTAIYDEVVGQGKYKPITTLKECAKVIPTISVGKNLSAVPTLDLRVIRSRFVWNSFSNKNAIEKKKPFTFAKDTVLSGWRAITQKGIISFLVDGFSAFGNFCYIFWFAHMYPRVRKKYGLK
ncbi:MAG: B12-binding domain-containing radical SAM protein [Clostridia bacterium]|nr:B12-binding domain-containing radical SAM protein [Clostridia bacterium]